MCIKNIIFIIASLFVQHIFAFDGELRVAVPNRITSTDPFMVKTAQDNFILPIIYESLFEKNLDGDLLPLLAKSFKGPVRGGNKLQIIINSGVQFSNGNELLVKDVIYSLQSYCLDERLHVRLSALKDCRPKSKLKIKAKDNNTIEIEIGTNYLYAIEQLSSGGIGIFKKVKKGKIGTGAFKVKSIDKGITNLERNSFSAFWRNKKKRFNKISFHFVSEKEVVSKINKQQFHMASMYLRPTIADFKNTNYSTIVHSENVISGVVLNGKIPGLSSILVRKSLQRSIFELDLTACKNGISKVLGMIPEGVGGYISDDNLYEEIRELKPVKSKKHFKLTFYRHLERSNNCEETKIIEVFKKHNLHLTIKHISNYKELFPLYLNPSTHGFIELFVYNSIDASSLLKRLMAGKKGNVFFYNSKKITSNLREAAIQPSLSKRFKFYRKINKEIFKQATFLSLYSISHTNIIHNCLRHKNTNSQFYNPNSFLYLLKLNFTNNCKLDLK